MTTQSNHSLIPSKFFSQLCGLIAAGLGVFAIVGWLMGWRILSGIRADYIPMAPNTALSFIVLGISLWALITERTWGLKLSRIGATVIFVLALVRFTELSGNINLNVDRWIFQVSSEKLGLIPVGRMALPTALNFLFASVALFLDSSLKRRWSVDALTRVLAGLTTFIGLAFCLGYIYGAPLLYGGTTIPMALNTAISFFVLGLGLVINNASHDAAERKRAAEALRKAHDELEVRVAERTAELAKANETLRAEIIERRQAEEDLRKSEERFKRLVESVTNYIYTVDIQDGKTASTKHGPGCVTVTGYLPEDYEADPSLWYRMVYEEDRGTVMELANRVLSGETVPPLEHRIVRKDGQIRWVKDAIVTRYDEQGRLVAYDGLVQDITEKKKIEEQLRHAQKMEAVGQLAGGVAHDFNNILTAIVGYGNLLNMKIGEEDPLKHYVEQVLASTERAAQLTQGLLAFSRKQIINPKPVNLNDIVKRVEKLLARLIGEDIELRVSLAPDDLIVIADTIHMEQILMNLATNARDAMPKGGILTVETEAVRLDTEFIRAHNYGMEGLYALVSVTDTGIGMDEKTAQKVFEPFFTTKEVGKGTGLGLAIVYGIVKQHNGYINVYSEPGKGTAFKLYLPLVSAKVEEYKPARIETPLGGTETILVAEDDNGVRDLTKHMLEEFGYTVIEAVDGKDAVEKFAENREKVHLLLLDVVMPKKNGREVYVEAVKIKPDVKVIFMSGYTANVIHKDGMLEEGLNFISKPVSPSELLKKVREALDGWLP